MNGEANNISVLDSHTVKNSIHNHPQVYFTCVHDIKCEDRKECGKQQSSYQSG